MIWGYIRVSTDQQTVENQRFLINQYCDKNNIAIDKWIEDEGVSGTKYYKKRHLGILVEQAKEGDFILCSELSRLGRSLYMIFEILDILTKRGCKLFAIKQNFNMANDINSKVIAFAFGLSAEIERDMISERTKMALARKKAEGVILGRPVGRKKAIEKFVLYGKDDEIRRLLEEGVSRRVIAKQLGVDRNTLYKYCLERDITSDRTPIHQRPNLDPTKYILYGKDEIIKYLLDDKELTIAEAAKQLNTTGPTLKTYLLNVMKIEPSNYIQRGAVVTDDEKLSMVEEYKAGSSMAELSVSHSLRQEKVSRILYEMEKFLDEKFIRPSMKNKQELTEEEIKEAVQLRAKRTNWKIIKETMNLDVSVERLTREVKKYAKENNIEIPIANNRCVFNYVSKWTDEAMEGLYLRWINGDRAVEIGIDYDCGPETVTRIAKYYCQKKGIEFVKRSSKKIPDDQYINIYHRAKVNHEYYKDIAKSYNCSTVAIKEVIRKYEEANGLFTLKRRIDDEQIERIMKLHNQNMNNIEIAKETGFAPETISKSIRRYCAANGIDIQTSKRLDDITDEQKDQVVQMAKDKISLYKIADYTKISKWLCKRIIIEWQTRNDQKIIKDKIFLKKDEDKVIFKLFAKENKSVKDIAKLYEVQTCTIYNHLRKYAKDNGFLLTSQVVAVPVQQSADK